MLPPFCPICRGAWDSSWTCSVCSYKLSQPDPAGIEVEPAEARQLLKQGAVLLDVRTDMERSIASIAGSKLMPLHELPARLAELDKSALVITQCHHGVRSLHAARLLRQAGFVARSLAGGIDRWSEEIDKGVPKY